jgi:hypothetical protein
MHFAQAIEAFLSDHDIRFNPGKQSLITTCINPACAKEDHMWIRRSNGRTICFRCNERWDWRGLVSVIARVNRSEAHSVLFGFGAGDEFALSAEERRDPFAPVEEVEKKDRPIKLPIDMPSAKTCTDALVYLKGRNVGWNQIDDFDIRWNEAMRAVVFPVRKGGVLYGWQARKIAPKPDEMRLISLSGFYKAHFLLNWDRAILRPAICVVEGPFDGVAADATEDVGGVATLGKGVSQEQVKLLLEAPARELFIGLDPDAYAEMFELIEMLGLRKTLRRALPPPHREDFGECLPDETRQVYNNASVVTGRVDWLEVHFKN